MPNTILPRPTIAALKGTAKSAVKYTVTTAKRLSIVGTVAIVAAFAAAGAHATQLSHDLTSGEIKKTGRILGQGSIHRYWTAHALPSAGLGVDIGLENSFLFRRNIIEMGDNSGVAPRVVPVPRLWFAWELPANVIMSGSFAPGLLFDGVTAFGLGAQYKFYENTDIATNVSVAASYTGVEAFGDLTAHNLDTSLQISRDLVFWQPYAGAGMILSTAAVDPGLAASGTKSRYFLPSSHVYLGARIDLVAKIALQMDLINEYVSFSVLLATSF